uniref:UBA domain-containing protein n=1 Tax=Meloidogyne javanica TaxID=6303 RepID=A0A915M969_MELJA
MDDSVANTVQIVLPNGTKKVINRSEKVPDVLKANCDDENYENFALVFFGRKLALDQKLETIQHLNENRPLYIICQKENNQKSKENKEEINKKLQACRASYRALIEDALPQVSAEAFKLLLSYMHENKCENYKQVLKDYPNFVYDQIGDAAICDFRLLIQFILKNDDFAYKHPDCLSVFKKALDNVSAKFSSTSTSVRFPSALMGGDLAMPMQNNPSTGTQLITQQMLSQAFAVALGETAQPASNSQQSSSTQQTSTSQNDGENNNPRANFATQLQQMHEFGFTDDNENIQALLLTNGDVEQALQIIIAMRE